MNHKRYRLVFNDAVGSLLPVAEITRSHGRTAGGILVAAAVLAGLAAPTGALAELPVPSTGGATPRFEGHGQASFQVNGAQAFVNQVGNKSILNWQSFNLGAGHSVQFRQVDSLATNKPVADANFTSLNRIWDRNPSVIAGSISQAAGQKANVIMVNTNGIAFMGGSQVNLNSFTASSLNMADNFVLDSLLTTQSLTPQFEGSSGFVKVFDGASISAGSQGRVMLLAPTVVNHGRVQAPDGQVIAAAGTKVYLRSASGQDPNVRGLLVEVDSAAGLGAFDVANTGVANGMLDGQPVALADAATDKLGHATNLGELSSPRGNVTIIGFAVNQQGVTRATTSVVANGSVYLLAKDRAVNNAQSTRGGRVTLGERSQTSVVPELGDATGTPDGPSGAGLALASRVHVLGQDLRMASGAVVDVPSGAVAFTAMDDPSLLASSGDPFATASAPASAAARIHIAPGARIQVAGLEQVQVSVARNSVEVELRGDELKDSPVNRDGPLRGEKVYVDVGRALASANAGKPNLIATDSLESYQGRLERTVAERSTAGGSVTLLSQGEVIVESGAVVDLSGGSLLYTPATVKTTQLVSGGKLTDVSDADAQTRFDAIATRYVIDFGRWNHQEVIDLGQSLRYDPGYVEGMDAGALHIIGIGAAVLQGTVVGRTTLGELQQDGDVAPVAASLRLGTGAVAGDYKLNQRIEYTSLGTALPADFGFGSTLPDAMKTTLALNPSLLAEGNVGHLQVFSNQAAVVRDELRAPRGGSVAITAKGVQVQADMVVPSGALDLKARTNNVDIVSVPLDVTVADKVTLSARGLWVNDLAAIGTGSDKQPMVHGGTITLSAAGDVRLGAGTLVDVGGAGHVTPDRLLVRGNGGDVTLEAGAGASAVGDHTQVVAMGGSVRGHGLGKGGSLTINTAAIQLGGRSESDALALAPSFVASGGFANFNLIGRDGVTVADGTLLTPTVESLELQPGFQLQPTGARVEDFSRVLVRDDQERQTAHLTLTADGASRGNVLLGTGSRILADDGAKLTLNAGNRIDIRGAVHAAGGKITARLNRALSLGAEEQSSIWLGAQARLDASGAARNYVDPRGAQLGQVLPGGTVELNAQAGYVVSQAGSVISVDGAAPVRLDVPNEAGSLGRMVGSDAGTVSITAREGMLLDGAFQARAGGASHRGGNLKLAYGLADDLDNGFVSPAARTLVVAQTVTPSTTGLEPVTGLPGAVAAQARVAVQAMESGGFDRVALTGRDAIGLESGVAWGFDRVPALREIQLDAPRLETGGGDVVLRAHTVRLGNYDPQRQGAGSAPAPGAGVLRVDAQVLELAGDQSLVGMARAELGGSQLVSLSGIATSGNPRPVATLQAASDVVLHGAVVAPSTYAQYTIDAPGHAVSFTRNTDAPAQPLSAIGSLRVEALDIVQGGNVWAPFGQIDLHAGNSLTFVAGSLTSTAAAPGSVTPFGQIENGRAWIYAVGGAKIAIGGLEQTAVRAVAKSIDMQPGATVDLSGGGELQAYEFTVGPGGSQDYLDRPDTYAVLPGYRSGFAPRDVQEVFDRASGESVYLADVPGLADGVYALLPAHYALLPNAFAVRLDAGHPDVLPGQSFTQQDGTRVAAGYVTDSRARAPKDALWQGVEVLTGEQVRARSEISTFRASQFFDTSSHRPQDAGLLAISTQGSGSDSLKLGATFRLGAEAAGRGAAVDISAQSLALVSGTPAGIDESSTRIDVGDLNAMGARSLLIGGTRAAGGDTTTLTIGARHVTLANDADHALKAGEIILAAREVLSLRPGSLIDAQGGAGDAGQYTTAGNGALVRAASTSARFERSGNPDRSQGSLVGEPASVVRAADYITLDATRTNDFKGEVQFRKDGAAVAGNLAVGATRFNLGAAPLGSEGITYDQAALDALDALQSLLLTSYSSFDLYGAVNVGGLFKDDLAVNGVTVHLQGTPSLENLTLLGAGLFGVDNSGLTASLRARNLTLANPQALGLAPVATPGDGTLAVLADRLTLAAGSKEIQGFGAVRLTANEMNGEGVGATVIGAPVQIDVARITGDRGSKQTLGSTGALSVTARPADRGLAQVEALGASWELAGTRVDFSTAAALPSGSLSLKASDGDMYLGADARIDVGGRTVQFFDVGRAAWAGRVELESVGGNVDVTAADSVDVSAAPGGDAGTLVLRAVDGTATLAPGSIRGASPADAQGRQGEGARIDVDVGTLGNFSALNSTIGEGGFDGAIAVRVRNGNLDVGASDQVKAQSIRLAADRGRLTVQGETTASPPTINADAAQGGTIALYAGDRLTLSGARLTARALQAGRDGGTVTLGSAGEDVVLAGGTIDTAGSGGGRDGTVLVRAGRLDGTALSNLYPPLMDTGTANSYGASLGGVTSTSLLRGLVVGFTPRATNTAASRFNLNGSGAKDIFFNGAAVQANRLIANETVYLAYDGTRFHMVDAEFANRGSNPVLATSTTTGTSTTNYVVSQPGLTSYRAGATLVYTPDADNIGATNRINVNNLGAKDIRYNNANLAAGALRAGEPVYLVYDGTAFAVALEANAPRATGSATALTFSSPRAAQPGGSLAFVANTNSAPGAATLTVNGVTGALLKNGVDLKTGDFRTNDLVYVSYDGSSFHMLTEMAAKVDVGTGVRLTSVAGDYSQPMTSAVTGASSIVVEAVRGYEALASSRGGILDANRISADTYRYLPAAERADLKHRIAGATPGFDVDKLHLRPGTEMGSDGQIILPRDLNLADYRFGGEPGVLTVRAAGNLLVNGNLSDGFNVATPASGSSPATLLAHESWAYRLVAGAERAAADPMAVTRGADGQSDVVLAAGKLIRTGTGDIHIASGNDIRLADDKAVIYTAGRLGEPIGDFPTPVNAQFSASGGDVGLVALGDIRNAERSEQLYSNWLFRQGRLNADASAYLAQPAWWVRFDQFQQGVGALGGGDVTMVAGGNVENLSASSPTQARMVSSTPDATALATTGGGSVRIEAGADLLGGQYYADRGDITIRAGGTIETGQLVGTGAAAKPLYTILGLGDAQARVQAREDVNIHAIINPHLVVQSSGAGANVNINNAASPLWSIFSTYGEDSAAALSSLGGTVYFHNAPAGSGQLASMAASSGAYRTPLNFSISSANYAASRALGVLPASLALVSFQQDVRLDGVQSTMIPSARGNLEVLAAGAARLPLLLNLSDLAPMPNAVSPAGNTSAFAATTLTAHATQPVHAGDTEPARVYARGGDIAGGFGKLNLTSAKPVWVLAGQDVKDLGLAIQHPNVSDVSRIEAGRDIAFSAGSSRLPGAYIWVAGPGRLELSAGRNVDMGTSAGIVSRGNLDNPALPAVGADIHVAAGVGSAGIGHADAIDRLLSALAVPDVDEGTVWLARWLTGNDTLDASTARAAVQAVANQDAQSQRMGVRNMLFTALRETGRDSTRSDSPYAGDYSRGYAALELVFPGVGQKSPDGRFTNYSGDVNLFASRILTEAGGNIELVLPGGDLVVGLANTPAALLGTQTPGAGIGLTDSGVLGLAVVAAGDIKGFARGDVSVNQSRILTVGGGDVLLWSSEGDIDAGKGKKTASVVPPPLILVDRQGNVTQVLQGAATGSGIGALSSGGVTAGDVDLIAPRGTVNAGDAGIRAGNLNIAAQVVVGAENISVSGTSRGTPVADTSAITTAASGATSGSDEVARTTAALTQSAAQLAQTSQVLEDAFKPSLVRVDVLGFGQ